MTFSTSQELASSCWPLTVVSLQTEPAGGALRTDSALVRMFIIADSPLVRMFIIIADSPRRLEETNRRVVFFYIKTRSVFLKSIRILTALQVRRPLFDPLRQKQLQLAGRRSEARPSGSGRQD